MPRRYSRPRSAAGAIDEPRSDLYAGRLSRGLMGDRIEAALYRGYVHDDPTAGAADSPKAATALLSEALALWRGPALADHADAAFAAPAIARWEEQRAMALEAWMEARLAHGEHASLVGELDELVRRYPLRERLRAAHMRARGHFMDHRYYDFDEDIPIAVTELRYTQFLSKELGVDRRLLYKWRDRLEPIDHAERKPINGKERELRLQVAHLKRLVADKTLEADFFKDALQKIEARRQKAGSGETACTTKSGS